MKKLFVITMVFAAAFLMGNTHAQAAQATQGGQGDKATTIQGELVDLGCYLSMGAKGADHRSCAEKCINSGMPMGVLTSDGALYLLTENHDNLDPFNSAKQMAADQVSVTGPISERNGMKSIEVKEIKNLSGEQKAPKG